MTAKKKNTLKDLDAFLKQEASSLVTPKKINAEEKTPEEQAPPVETQPAEVPQQSEQNTEPGSGTPTAEEQPQTEALTSSDGSPEAIVLALQSLQEQEGEHFREKFYDIIRASLEKLDHSNSADKMLINTTLYLQNQDNWKAVIKSYWESR